MLCSKKLYTFLFYCCLSLSPVIKDIQNILISSLTFCHRPWQHIQKCIRARTALKLLHTECPLLMHKVYINLFRLSNHMVKLGHDQWCLFFNRMQKLCFNGWKLCVLHVCALKAVSGLATRCKHVDKMSRIGELEMRTEWDSRMAMWTELWRIILTNWLAWILRVKEETCTHASMRPGCEWKYVCCMCMYSICPSVRACGVLSSYLFPSLILCIY